MRRGKIVTFLFPFFVVALVMESDLAARANVDRQFPILSVAEHYRRGVEALRRRDWAEAERNFYIVTTNFSSTTYALDAHFHLGLAYYKRGEYDLANVSFGDYLSSQTNPVRFEETMELKFHIAEAFRKGAKRHFWGSKRMPKLVSGTDLAEEIYDEIIAALPNHDLAARALFAKAALLFYEGELDKSKEAYQTLIRRFTKHELSPESYFRIGKVYIAKVEKEFQNPDILVLAEINLRKFEEDFPKEKRIALARDDIMRMKEMYAKGLFETGYFYERKNKPEAACIFYKKAVSDFPETSVAGCCRKRIKKLCPKLLREEKAEEINFG